MICPLRLFAKLSANFDLPDAVGPDKRIIFLTIYFILTPRYLLRLLLSIIDNNKFLSPFFITFSTMFFKSEVLVIGVLLASIIISPTFNKPLRDFYLLFLLSLLLLKFLNFLKKYLLCQISYRNF